MIAEPEDGASPEPEDEVPVKKARKRGASGNRGPGPQSKGGRPAPRQRIVVESEGETVKREASLRVTGIDPDFAALRRSAKAVASRTVAASDLEDVVQQVMLEVWIALLCKDKVIVSPEALVVAVTTRRARDHVRRQRRLRVQGADLGAMSQATRDEGAAEDLQLLLASVPVVTWARLAKIVPGIRQQGILAVMRAQGTEDDCCKCLRMPTKEVRRLFKTMAHKVLGLGYNGALLEP